MNQDKARSVTEVPPSYELKHHRHFRLNAIKLGLLRPVLKDAAKQCACLHTAHKNNDLREDRVFILVGRVSAG